MQKKLLAVAVAGALTLPGAALAQSSVTITGYFQVSLASERISNRSAARPAANSTSETRVQDESSRIIFRVREDLGGGLAAVGQVDWRIPIDTGADAASGANWVGISSKSWGTIYTGRVDLHYGYREDQVYSRGGSLKADNTSVLGFAGAGAVAIAGNTRTPNVIVWDSPNWSGVTVRLGYSTTGATGAEADMTSGARKGSAWNFAPQYNAKNWGIGYSYWTQKNDAPAAGLATGDQRADRVNAHYQMGNFRIGFAWDKSKVKQAIAAGAVAAGTELSNRTAWTIPLRYDWGGGKHNVTGHYTRARDDKATAGVQDGAKMIAVSYSHHLSKRTSVALTYAKITNDAGAAYNLFTTAGGLGSAAQAIFAGEDPRELALTVKHSF